MSGRNEWRFPMVQRSAHGQILRGQHQSAANRAHAHEQYEPFPEGDADLPDPGWDQHDGSDGFPQARSRRWSDPATQWGDIVNLEFPRNNAGTPVVKITKQILDLALLLPTVCFVRLSAVEITGQLLSSSTSDFAEFVLDLGCGRAAQSKHYRLNVGILNGATDTDLLLTLPVRKLRISAHVSVSTNIGSDFVVQVCAQAAPYTTDPALVTR